MKNDLAKELLQEMYKIHEYFNRFILSTEFCLDDSGNITWSKYESGITGQFYSKQYTELVNNRQYSFLLKESKGLLQIFFATDGGRISKAKMAFYPYPVNIEVEAEEFERIVMHTDDDILAEYAYDTWNLFNSDIDGDITNDDDDSFLNKYNKRYSTTNSSHIRIDYDPNVKTHHICEMQIAGINSIRLPFSSLVSPFIFFAFIIKNVFPEEYNDLKTLKNEPIDKLIKSYKTRSLPIEDFEEENIYFTHN